MEIKTTYIQRFGDAMELLCRKRPSDDLLKGWLHPEKEDERLQEFAIEHGPEWAQGIVIIDSARVMADTPEEEEAHLPLDMQEITGNPQIPKDAVRMNVLEASGQLLDYAVAMALGLLYEGWNHDANSIMVREPDDAKPNVFKPAEPSTIGLAYGLLQRLKREHGIGSAPHLDGWMARAGAHDNAKLALGGTPEEAVLRVYVLLKCGPIFYPPESLVRQVEISRAFPPEAPDFDRPRLST